MDIGRDMSLKRMWVLSLFPVALFPSCRQGMTTVAQPLKPVFVHVVNPPLEYPEFPESREKIKKIVTTAEAAVGGLYRSFCKLGTNDQERI